MSKKTKKQPSTQNKKADQLLRRLNREYFKVHKTYEDLFWKTNMGDTSLSGAYVTAREEREAFRGNTALAEEVAVMLNEDIDETQKRSLEQWKRFFSMYRMNRRQAKLFEKIAKLEQKIANQLQKRKEGYNDPYTKSFVVASVGQMREMMATHDDERIRKACFEALEKLADTCSKEFVKLVQLRNQFATAAGYEDFYAYKLDIEEGMTKEELFSIFDNIYQETKYAFKDLKRMEKEMPGLNLPWNRSYMLSGDFTKLSDEYYPFEEAIPRWAESFARMGIGFDGGTLTLDLLDRKQKYNNGFCHWPSPVYFDKTGKRPGSANFTCNVVFGQVGSSEDAYNTLFHEGGHAAHFLNSQETEICVNTEYPPSSTAWAETQSMFLDSVFGSIEWSTRYAKNESGEPFPFELFKKELKKLHLLSPLGLNSITAVMDFERTVYEARELDVHKLHRIAKQTMKKYTGMKVESIRLLSIPHIYSWESSCAYQGYGLAELAVMQWREYFYKKYGYIVDNPKVGQEMKRMWAYGGFGIRFLDAVTMATGKPLSPKPYLRVVTASYQTKLRRAKERIAKLGTIPKRTVDKNMGATIRLVHGKKTVATNKTSFDTMAKTYARWLQTQRIQ